MRWHLADRTGHALPIIAGTVIRLTVDHLPSRGEPKPLWLWWSKVDTNDTEVDRCWQASCAASISSTPSGR